jgi:DNA-directed RNA polymerase subunit RPC12/RpoP
MPDTNTPDNDCSCPKHAPEPVKCPECGHELDVLMFMDAQPDGYVCKPCGRLFGLNDMAPGPRVI